jgi:hypothetical protein
MASSKRVTIPELYIEVMHSRGNFSKFETKETSYGAELMPGHFNKEIDVWVLRKWSMDTWRDARGIEVAEQEFTDIPDNGRLYYFYVTRFPELESGIDSTYHPSVGLENIDPERVKDLF